MLEKRDCPCSPADSSSRSPAPIIRSNSDWEKVTSLIRSSGISRPNLATTPERKMSRSVVSTKWVVDQRSTRPTTVASSTTSPSTPTTIRAGCCRSPAGMTTQAAPPRRHRDHDRDRDQHGHDQGQPVRPQVVDQLLVLRQQPLRERQPCLLRGCTVVQSQPACCMVEDTEPRAPG